MRGDGDTGKVPYSVLYMLYSSPVREAIQPLQAKELFGEEWEGQSFSELEKELINTENSFDFSLFMRAQPQANLTKLFEGYGNHLRQRHEETNHSKHYTHKLMNHLYQHTQYLYFNNELNKENTDIAWELTAHITTLTEMYSTHNLLDSVIAMHEVKADTYMMIGIAENRTDLLEIGLNEIKKAQALGELHPSTRNIKGIIYQYLAAMSTTQEQVRENINKSIFQFEKALNNEFNQEYIQNYLTSFQLIEGFDLKGKEEYYQRERSFLEKLRRRYPDIEIEFTDDDDEEYYD